MSTGETKETTTATTALDADGGGGHKHCRFKAQKTPLVGLV